MKKKLIAVLLLCAMVITLLPAVTAKADGIAFLYNKKKPTVMLDEDSTTNIYVGGSRVALKYYISGSDSVKGKWKSSDTSVVKVSQNGSCKAVGNGYADITFTYKEDGETQVLETRLKSMTKATAVTLTPASALGGNLKVGESSQFTANLTTNPKALKVNPNVKSTYKTFFYLYSDAACTKKADSKIAVVDGNGKVTAVGAGTVYLRAEAKVSANSKSGVVKSNILPIIVASPVTVVQSDYNQLTVTTKTPINSVIVQDAKTNVVIPTTVKLDATKMVATVSTGSTPLNGQYKVIVNGTDTTTVTCQFSTIVKQTDSNRIEVISTYDIQTVLIQNSNKQVVSQLTDMKVDDTKKKAVVTVNQTVLNGTYYVIINGIETHTLTCAPSTLDKIVLTSSNAVLDQKGAANGVVKAYIYYTLLDQFGNDVTHNPLYPKEVLYGFTTSANASSQLESVDQGVMALNIPITTNSIPTVGNTYNITMIMAAGTQMCRYEGTVTLANPAIISSIDLAGIYTYQGPANGYKKVVDASTNNLIAGATTILPFNNSMTTVGAYYMLIQAEDQYGNPVARKGITQSEISVAIITDANKATNLSLATTESAGSIEIDGVKYLAYPLNAGMVGEGTATISVYCMSAGVKTLQLTVAKKAELSKMVIQPPLSGYITVKKNANGNGYDMNASQVAIPYTATSTNNLTVTDFETLVRFSGATESEITVAKTIGKYYIQPKFIESSMGSQFWWQKKDDGTAELLYTPMFIPRVVNGVISYFAEDKITIMKGTVNQQVYSLYQYAEQ